MDIVIERGTTKSELFFIDVLFKTNEGKARTLVSVANVESFKVVEKEKTGQILMETSIAVTEKTATGSRASETIEALLYPSVCYVHVQDDNLAGAVIAEVTYPEGVIHDLITRILNEFASNVTIDLWSSMTEGKAPFDLGKYLSEHVIMNAKGDCNNAELSETKNTQDAIVKLENDQDERNLELNAKDDCNNGEVSETKNTQDAIVKLENDQDERNLELNGKDDCNNGEVSETKNTQDAIVKLENDQDERNLELNVKEDCNNEKVNATKNIQRAMMKLENDQDERILELHALSEAATQRMKNISMPLWDLENKSFQVGDPGFESSKFKFKRRSQCCTIL